MVTGIILASASPRREQLLRQVGYEFQVLPSRAEEDNTAELSPEELVQTHARAKAWDVARQVAPADIVIGADTLVVLDGKVFGKPGSAEQACRMLQELSGRTHSVWSGIAIVKEGRCLCAAVETRVTLGRLNEEEIKRYVATGEPLDKAGAYAVQGIGAVFVEKLDGCYFNVVGLPLNALSRLLSEAGVDLL